MIRAACDALVAVVLAPRCAVCDEALEQPSRGAVCPPCWRSIPPPAFTLCRLCGDTLTASHASNPVDHLCARCRRSPRLITIGRSIAPYEGTLREILHALKYNNRRSVSRRLGWLMAHAGSHVLDGADCVVPVPLHFTRHYTRGFNQAAELAKHVGLPVVHALRRRRATVTQTDLPEADRHANVRDAFAVKPWRRVNELVVVVVDDVSTTGATIDACARVLLDAGAKEVRALTAARAVSRLQQ